MGDLIQEFKFGLGFAKVETKNLDDATNKAKKSAKEVRAEWAKAGKAIGKSLAVIGAAGAAAALGLFKFAESSAAVGDEIAKTSKGLGIAADELQRLRFAAERSGGSAQGMTRALRTMTLNLQNAAQKGTGPVADGLEAIGLRVEDIQGLGVEDQFGVISDALQSVANQADRSGIAMQIFGSRGGTALKPLLDEGSAGIKALGDEAERLGIVLNKDALDASEKFTDSVLDMKSTIKGLLTTAGIELIPQIQRVTEQIKEWAISNRELIKTKLQDVLDLVIKSVKQLGDAAGALLPLLIKLAEVGLAITNALGTGGATAAMLGFKAAMAGSLGPAGALAIAVAAIASAMSNLAISAQDARIQLSEAVIGRGKRGEAASRRVVSPEEGRLQAAQADVRRQLTELERTEERDAGSAAIGGAGLVSSDLRNRRRAALRGKFAELERLRKAEVSRSATARTAFDASGQQALKDSQRVLDATKRLQDAVGVSERGTDDPTKKKKRARGGGGESAEDLARVDAEFGEELRRLAAQNDIGAVGINAALTAGAGSFKEGANRAVARKAALSRLGSLAGKDFSQRPGAGQDPLLSQIFGEDVPDVELSSLAAGAQPQTLLVTINNTFSFDIDQEISGAGNPQNVADRAVQSFRDFMEGALEKSTKLQKVRFAR